VGHLALRRALQQETFDPVFRAAPVFAQFSSMGSLDAKWLHSEFQRDTLCAGKYLATSGNQLLLPTHEPLIDPACFHLEQPGASRLGQWRCLGFRVLGPTLSKHPAPEKHEPRAQTASFAGLPHRMVLSLMLGRKVWCQISADTAVHHPL